ncbi:MAG TPA: hypothetical protein VJP80_01020, partial [Candidatus Saccharimonadales bacterium]|nr:hypothetical protein [Candidatus Saccharimonadales bacterium]
MRSSSARSRKTARGGDTTMRTLGVAAGVGGDGEGECSGECDRLGVAHDRSPVIGCGSGLAWARVARAEY